MIRLLIVLTVLLFHTLATEASNRDIICDNEKADLNKVMSREGTKYVLKKDYHFKDTLIIPNKCELFFDGGSLKGPILFNNTLLKGDVKLVGSSISGKIENKLFESSWLCYGDGIHDDARNINQMIDVCGKIRFKKGNYLLISKHKAPKVENVFDEWQIEAHIGISISNIELIGTDKDVVFIAKDPCVTICIYSPPYQFERTVRNIRIENINFSVINDGKEIRQLMHTIKSVGVNGLVIRNCFFDDFWGDAICLHSYGDMPSTGERTRNSNVVIKDNIIKGGSHYKTRNGISIVSGVNIKIEKNIIEQTSGSGMPGAIDIEANFNVFSLNNILIKGNVIKNCRGTAGGICINSNKYGAPAYNIKIKNNHISGCTSGLAFVVQKDDVTGNFEITGNVVDEDTLPYQFIGNGKSSNWSFQKNIFKKNTSVKIPGDIQVASLFLYKNKFGNN